MDLRSATPSDVKEIKSFLAVTWLETYTFIPIPVIEQIFTTWHDIKKLELELKNRDILCNLVFDNSNLIGLITLKRFDDDQYFLARLYIKSNYQRKGIGKLLLNNFIETHKPSKIFLHVEEKNQKAIDFYLKNGFLQIKKNSENILDYELNTIVMMKYTCK